MRVQIIILIYFIFLILTVVFLDWLFFRWPVVLETHSLFVSFSLYKGFSNWPSCEAKQSWFLIIRQKVAEKIWSYWVCTVNTDTRVHKEPNQKYITSYCQFTLAKWCFFTVSSFFPPFYCSNLFFYGCCRFHFPHSGEPQFLNDLNL